MLHASQSGNDENVNSLNTNNVVCDENVNVDNVNCDTKNDQNKGNGENKSDWKLEREQGWKDVYDSENESDEDMEFEKTIKQKRVFKIKTNQIWIRIEASNNDLCSWVSYVKRQAHYEEEKNVSVRKMNGRVATTVVALKCLQKTYILRWSWTKQKDKHIITLTQEHNEIYWIWSWIIIYQQQIWSMS